MPQKDSLLDGFGNSTDNIESSERFVTLRIAGSARLALCPLEHAAFRHAGDGKGEMRIPCQQLLGVKRFEQRGNQVLCGVLVRKERIPSIELSDGGVKDGDKREQKNIAQNSTSSVSVPEVKYFVKNPICGMRPVAVAPAGAQMRGQCKRVRKCGQQKARSGHIREVFLRIKFTQLLFQVEFQFAEETVARGTSSHSRPPDCDHQGWCAVARCANFCAS